MEENYKATTRNGHVLMDMYNPETNTLDIRSNGLYPSNVLSNLCSNSFRFDGVVCGSMEGFLQSLKRQDPNKQRQICSMKGGNARKMSVTSWQTDQIVWWKGKAIDRQGQAYHDLIHRAYKAMFEQNERFRAALMQTSGTILAHSTGENNPYKTILTPAELCGILTELRDSYDKRDKTQELIEKSVVNEYGHFASEKPTAKKIIYVDMGGVLMDFHAGLEQIGDELRKEYAGRYNEVPNIVSYLPPIKGAVDAMNALCKSGIYDVYILSTSPWNNPSTWSDKVEWVNRYLDKYYCKRLILSHHKNLLRGDYIIDDRGKHGTSGFNGEWICFGSNRFPDWRTVLDYLKVHKE